MRTDDIFINCQKVVLNIRDGNKDSEKRKNIYKISGQLTCLSIDTDY